MPTTKATDWPFVESSMAAWRAWAAAAKDNTTMQIITERHELSDTSPVFDVIIIKDGQRWNIPAVSERDAEELRFKLVEAFRDHSNETIREW